MFKLIALTVLSLFMGCAAFDAPSSYRQSDAEFLEACKQLTPEQRNQVVNILAGMSQDLQGDIQNSIQIQMLWEMQKMNGNRWVP